MPRLGRCVRRPPPGCGYTSLVAPKGVGSLIVIWQILGEPEHSFTRVSRVLSDGRWTKYFAAY